MFARAGSRRLRAPTAYRVGFRQPVGARYGRVIYDPTDGLPSSQAKLSVPLLLRLLLRLLWVLRLLRLLLRQTWLRQTWLRLLLRQTWRAAGVR